MLRRNGDDRVPDKVLIAADLDGESEELIKWTISRSQSGDILFLLHVIGPSPKQDDSKDDPDGTKAKKKELEDQMLRERIQALADMLGRLKTMCEDLKVMTSMRVVRRQGLAPAVVREAIALKATRVVIGGTGWFVQKSNGPMRSWTVLLSYVEARLPTECLIMLVDDGRLAAVKRGKLAEIEQCNGNQQTNALCPAQDEKENKESTEGRSSKKTGPQIQENFTHIGPRAPRMHPSVGVSGGDESNKRQGSFEEANVGGEKAAHLRSKSIASPVAASAPVLDARGKLASPGRKDKGAFLSPGRWGSGKVAEATAKGDGGDRSPLTGFAGLFRASPLRRRSPTMKAQERPATAGQAAQSTSRHGSPVLGSSRGGSRQGSPVNGSAVNREGGKSRPDILGRLDSPNRQRDGDKKAGISRAETKESPDLEQEAAKAVNRNPDGPMAGAPGGGTLQQPVGEAPKAPASPSRVFFPFGNVVSRKGTRSRGPVPRSPTQDGEGYKTRNSPVPRSSTFHENDRPLNLPERTRTDAAGKRGGFFSAISRALSPSHRRRSSNDFDLGVQSPGGDMRSSSTPDRGQRLDGRHRAEIPRAQTEVDGLQKSSSFNGSKTPVRNENLSSKQPVPRSVSAEPGAVTPEIRPSFMGSMAWSITGDPKLLPRNSGNPSQKTPEKDEVETGAGGISSAGCKGSHTIAPVKEVPEAEALSPRAPSQASLVLQTGGGATEVTPSIVRPPRALPRLAEADEPEMIHEVGVGNQEPHMDRGPRADEQAFSWRHQNERLNIPQVESPRESSPEKHFAPEVQKTPPVSAMKDPGHLGTVTVQELSPSEDERKGAEDEEDNPAARIKQRQQWLWEVAQVFKGTCDGDRLGEKKQEYHVEEEEECFGAVDDVMTSDVQASDVPSGFDERVPIVRVQTVPKSFSWGEGDGTPSDWPEWAQRPPRTTTVAASPSKENPIVTPENTSASNQGCVPSLGHGSSAFSVGTDNDPAQLGSDSALSNNKYPTFVRRFSPARRARGQRGGSGQRGTTRTVLNKVVAPNTSITGSLHVTKSEGLGEQSSAEQDPAGTALPPSSRAAPVAPDPGLAPPRLNGTPDVPSASPPPDDMTRRLRRRTSTDLGDESDGQASSRASNAPAGAAMGLQVKPLVGEIAKAKEPGAWDRAAQDKSMASQENSAVQTNPFLNPSFATQDSQTQEPKAWQQDHQQLQHSRQHLQGTSTSNMSSWESQLPLGPAGSLWVYPFTAEQLCHATNGFSPALRISRKPHFSVYRGQLPDGRLVTVKVASSEGDESSETKLWAEAKALANVRHRNLVELVGVCYRQSAMSHQEGTGQKALRARALVYEYVDGIPLQEALQPESDLILPWVMRHKVATDVAQAVMYLHTGLPELTTHGSISTSNVILLRESTTAKLGGFNAARGAADRSRYGAQHESAAEDDVIAFGFLLLELICGQKRHSVREVIPLLWAGKAEDIADPAVRDGCSNVLQFHQLAYAVLVCLDSQRDTNASPTMSRVLLALNSDTPPWLVAQTPKYSRAVPEEGPLPTPPWTMNPIPGPSFDQGTVGAGAPSLYGPGMVNPLMNPNPFRMGGLPLNASANMGHMGISGFPGMFRGGLYPGQMTDFDAMSMHSQLHASEVGDTASVNNSSVYMMRIEQLQQQQQQLMIMLLQQQQQHQHQRQAMDGLSLGKAPSLSNSMHGGTIPEASGEWVRTGSQQWAGGGIAPQTQLANGFTQRPPGNGPDATTTRGWIPGEEAGPPGFQQGQFQMNQPSQHAANLISGDWGMLREKVGAGVGGSSALGGMREGAVGVQQNEWGTPPWTQQGRAKRGGEEGERRRNHNDDEDSVSTCSAHCSSDEEK